MVPRARVGVVTALVGRSLLGRAPASVGSSRPADAARPYGGRARPPAGRTGRTPRCPPVATAPRCPAGSRSDTARRRLVGSTCGGPVRAVRRRRGVATGVRGAAADGRRADLPFDTASASAGAWWAPVGAGPGAPAPYRPYPDTTGGVLLRPGWPVGGEPNNDPPSWAGAVRAGRRPARTWVLATLGLPAAVPRTFVRRRVLHGLVMRARRLPHPGHTEQRQVTLGSATEGRHVLHGLVVRARWRPARNPQARTARHGRRPRASSALRTATPRRPGPAGGARPSGPGRTSGRRAASVRRRPQARPRTDTGPYAPACSGAPSFGSWPNTAVGSGPPACGD